MGRQAAAAANKGPTREEVFERVDSILDDMLIAVQKAPIETKVDKEEKEKQDEPKEESIDTDSSDNLVTAQEIAASKDDIISAALESAANRWKENDGWLPSKMTQT